MPTKVTTQPVILQCGIKRIELTALVTYSYIPASQGDQYTPGEDASIEDVEVLSVLDDNGDRWSLSEQGRLWIENSINRDELRASIDPEFAAARKAALDAYHAEG